MRGASQPDAGGLKARGVPRLAWREARRRAPQLKALLTPYPSDEMMCWPVSPRAGNVKNNDPSLIEPMVGAD